MFNFRKYRYVLFLPLFFSVAVLASPCDWRLGEALSQPDVMRAIKLNVQRIWKIKKHSDGLTQTEVANALNRSQSAVSKMINDLDAHPWTAQDLQAFARFTNTPLAELVPVNIANQFSIDESKPVDPKADLRIFCRDAVRNYAAGFGQDVTDDQIKDIVNGVCNRLSRFRRPPTQEKVTETIRTVVAHEAIRKMEEQK